jgi:hypothetical protein
LTPWLAWILFAFMPKTIKVKEKCGTCKGMGTLPPDTTMKPDYLAKVRR